MNVEELAIFIGPPSKSLYGLVKVEYLSDGELKDWIKATAKELLWLMDIGFDDFNNNLICDVKCGPNNKIRKKDLELLLRKYGY